MVKTTILVEKKTRKKLRDIGLKGETYDEIIAKLLKSIDSLETGLRRLDSSESIIGGQ
jgi:hypothetical protein